MFFLLHFSLWWKFKHQFLSSALLIWILESVSNISTPHVLRTENCLHFSTGIHLLHTFSMWFPLLHSLTFLCFFCPVFMICASLGLSSGGIWVPTAAPTASAKGPHIEPWPRALVSIVSSPCWSGMEVPPNLVKKLTHWCELIEFCWRKYSLDLWFWRKDTWQRPMLDFASLGALDNHCSHRLPATSTLRRERLGSKLYYI